MNYPPKWINKLLHLFCKEGLLEEIEGDLLEYYQHGHAGYGKRRANRLYLFHTIKFFRRYALSLPQFRFTKVYQFNYWYSIKPLNTIT